MNIEKIEIDYLIVGAGSSGCALAAELIKNTQSQVCLVEAGSKNTHPFITMPRGYIALWKKPKYYWQFPVIHKAGWPKNDHWFYGKGLGGSSAVNGTWYFRGQPADFDSWQQIGNGEWSWEVISNAYNYMENFHENGAHESRGINGPVQISKVKKTTSLTQAILAAGKEYGLNVVHDVNSPKIEVIGQTQMTVGRDGKRVSAYTAFLDNETKKSDNLIVMNDCLVEKILFEGKKAIGAEGYRNGKPCIWIARKSVILSAGVLQTPKLLQLSGVGDPELLRKFDIDVIHAQPNVGKNMNEHMMGEIRFRIKNDIGTNHEFRGWRLVKNVLNYYLTRKGAMAYGLPEISAMISTQKETKNWPDLQLGFLLATFEVPENGKSDAGRGRTELLPGMSIAGFVLRPKSQGSVAIQSASIHDPAVVTSNWFADPDDEDSMINLFNVIRTIAAQPALKQFIVEEMGPTKSAQTSEELKKNLPTLVRSGLHGTGTCRMGSPETGVVSSRLVVHGLENLRIVDCSVMPTPISGNTNGPAMALGIHAAKLIIQDLE